MKSAIFLISFISIFSNSVLGQENVPPMPEKLKYNCTTDNLQDSLSAPSVIHQIALDPFTLKMTHSTLTRSRHAGPGSVRVTLRAGSINVLEGKYFFLLSNEGYARKEITGYEDTSNRVGNIEFSRPVYSLDGNSKVRFAAGWSRSKQTDEHEFIASLAIRSRVLGSNDQFSKSEQLFHCQVAE
jgi:hypothetical protein